MSMLAALKGCYDRLADDDDERRRAVRLQRGEDLLRADPRTRWRRLSTIDDLRSDSAGKLAARS